MVVNSPILVVDDEAPTADVVRAYLERDGFSVAVARTGAQALDVFRQTSPRLVILDVMLPERDGFQVAQRIREGGSSVPILMLSARAEEVDRILGLRLGADDYLVKPFSPRELVARVHALLRRAELVPTAPRACEVDDVVLIADRFEAMVAGREIELTHFEFTLLLALMERPGQVRSRRQLLSRAPGGEGSALERTVDVHVARIRQKLQAAGSRARIHTVRGVGYKMARSAMEAAG